MGDLVVKDNALINASYNLDLVEQRLILLAIIEARQSGKGINANDPLTIHAESYINQFSAHRNTAYEGLKSACKALFSRYFTYQEPRGKAIANIQSRWVSQIAYIDEQAKVEYRSSWWIAGEKEKAEKKNEKLTPGQQYAMDAEKAEGDEKKKVSGAVRRGILAILKDNYGVEENDFISAELEIVPAGKARDAGFDRSMVLAYGQDDRVCAYPSMRAILAAHNLKRTACCILVDKEEIGSVGATGMQSRFFENAVAEVMNLTEEYSDLRLRRCLANSCMLSSDVSCAFDPSYASVFESKNVAYMGGGMVLNKYTGVRGKSGSNDANAEYIAHIRNIFDQDKINFQTSELGKVDVGGGGTIAYILALYGMNVIDSGVPVLNMHAPWEIISKVDLYEAYRGYIAFLKEA